MTGRQQAQSECDGIGHVLLLGRDYQVVDVLMVVGYDVAGLGGRHTEVQGAVRHVANKSVLAMHAHACADVGRDVALRVVGKEIDHVLLSVGDVGAETAAVGVEGVGEEHHLVGSVLQARYGLLHDDARACGCFFILLYQWEGMGMGEAISSCISC